MVVFAGWGITWVVTKSSCQSVIVVGSGQKQKKSFVCQSGL
jgi:hypothetical protein